MVEQRLFSALVFRLLSSRLGIAGYNGCNISIVIRIDDELSSLWVGRLAGLAILRHLHCMTGDGVWIGLIDLLVVFSPLVVCRKRWMDLELVNLMYHQSMMSKRLMEGMKN